MKIYTKSLPLDQLGFGQWICPKMIVSHFKDGKWSPFQLLDTENFQISPASKVLHYAQEIFEGMKAYKTKQGANLFRPNDYISRMEKSADLLVMPTFPRSEYLAALKLLVQTSLPLIPDEPGTLYLRPTMIGTSPEIKVSASEEYTFFIIASPVGGYFSGGLSDTPSQINVWVDDQRVRAVRGGLGAAKTGANYAASLLSLKKSKQLGFDNVLFLDAITQTKLEELSGMNIFVVRDNKLITPPLKDTILPGITRNSILKLVQELGIPNEEKEISIEEIADNENSFQEIFATGTAAIITSIQSLNYKGRNIGNYGCGKVASILYKSLTDLYFGRATPQDKTWIFQINSEAKIQKKINLELSL